MTNGRPTPLYTVVPRTNPEPRMTRQGAPSGAQNSNNRESSMKTRLVAAFAALFLAAASAQAADPTAVISTPGITFEEYSSPTPVGQGLVDTSKLFFIDELTGPLGKAWYVFFDPQGPGDIAATITFASAITGVFITRADLDGSNAVYGNPGINYGSSLLIGLETRTDAISWVGNVLTINWHAIDPGDHIRVFTEVTQVPEPETYALMMAGLIGIGFVARRRRRG